MAVLLVRADPLLVQVRGHGHLDGVEHQVDLASSRDLIGPEVIGANDRPIRKLHKGQIVVNTHSGVFTIRLFTALKS